MNNLKLLSGSLRVGIGGPVGTGKTALVDKLCKSMRDDYNIATITNDIYTREDAEFLTHSGALEPERIVGVETGGCPHTAIREDASMNLAAVAELNTKFPGLSLIFIESGGDNLAATFSHTGESDQLDNHQRIQTHQGQHLVKALPYEGMFPDHRDVSKFVRDLRNYLM